MKTKKWEILLFSFLLLAAVLGWIAVNVHRNRASHGSITITVSGEDFGTYDLGKDQVIEIPTVDLAGNSHNNICTIKNGAAVMTEADCPDQICMAMPPIDDKGGYICCLPHGIFIMGTPSQDSAASQSGIDSVT